MKLFKKALASAVSLLLAAAIISPAAYASESTETSKAKWTFLIYLCGTDLESGGYDGIEYGGAATGDLDEIVKAAYSSDVNVVVETGGANIWANDVVSAEELGRYVLTEDGLSLVDTQPDADMGDPETLEAFLKWAGENYPAERTGLVFWDHGSGSILGVCIDEKHDADTLLLPEITYALYDTVSYYPNGFEFIGFDACLMSTLECANTVAPYAKYMYASEELEPGTGWNYTDILTYLAENPDADGKELGAEQCSSYYEYCQSEGEDPSITFAITDLSKIQALNDAFDAVSKEIYESDAQADIVRNILKADNFGGNNRTEGYTNMVDLKDLLDQVSEYAPSASAAIDALKDAVIYSQNGSLHENAGGLSLYYPLHISGTEELSIFREICYSTYYLAFVDGLAEGADLSDTDDGSSSLEDSDAITVNDVYLDGNGIYTVELEDMDAFAYATCALYYDDEEGGYIYLGEDDDVIIDYENYIITDNFDGSWMSLDGYLMPLQTISQGDTTSLYSSPILLNGVETNLRFLYNWDSGEYEILGTWDGIDPDTEMAGRTSGDISEGDTINFVYYYYDADGNEDYFYGDDITMSNNLEFYYAVLPEGDYEYCIYLYDIYGNYYKLGFTTFYVDENGDVSYYED